MLLATNHVLAWGALSQPLLLCLLLCCYAQELRFTTPLAPLDLRERHIDGRYVAAEDAENAPHVVHMVSVQPPAAHACTWRGRPQGLWLAAFIS